MPLFEENKTNHTQKTTQSQPSPSETKTKSNLTTIIGQLLPFAPLAFEQFTGQKVPQMSGTIAEIQLALSQIQTGLQTVVNNQQQLAQRINALESNATQQFTNLISQVQTIQSLKLTHEKERKQIEYNKPQLEENQEY